jgi:hypothetical protein
MKPIDIFYQGERVHEMDHLETAVDTIAAVKALILSKHGGEADVLVFLENGDEPLDEEIATHSLAGPTGLKLHLHRCRRVEVVVNFAGDTVERAFGPGVTVAHVKSWAAQHKFGMTKEEAGEHVLQIAGTQERPTPSTHIGTLATCPICRVAFDLVPNERVNGASELDCEG